jgi:hypothetical protein
LGHFVIDPVVAVRIVDWWDPEYKSFQGPNNDSLNTTFEDF